MFEIEKRFSPARVLRPVAVVEWKTVKCVLLIAAAGKWCPSEAKLNDTKRTNLALSLPISVALFTSLLFCLCRLKKKKKIGKWKANYCNPLKIQSITALGTALVLMAAKNLTTKCNYRQFELQRASIRFRWESLYRDGKWETVKLTGAAFAAGLYLGRLKSLCQI